MGPNTNEYVARVNAGEIEPDPAQLNIAQALDELAIELEEYETKSLQRSGILSRNAGKSKIAPPKGIYMHGRGRRR